MNIAFIGYGNMAKALASKWSHKHQLFFAGRTEERAAAVAAEFGARSGATTEAVAFGDVVVLATRYEDVLGAVEAAGGNAAFAGKVVIDINNPVEIQTFTSTMEQGSLTEAIIALLPDATVVKAFNMAQATVWSDPDMTYDGRTLVTLFTADDARGVEVGRELIHDVGSDAYHVGDARYAYQLEAMAAFVIKLLFTTDMPPRSVLNLIAANGLPKPRQT